MVHPKRSQGKIFGIGLSKTGTTSLARALEILGYRTKDFIGVKEYRPGRLDCIDLDVIDANDAFTDTPIPSFYRELDQRYPNSKFILTIRDMDGWLKSCKKQFTRALANKETAANNSILVAMYGESVFEKEKFESGYWCYVNGVYDYFRDRKEDLLVLDICANEGWDKLCAFLGQPIPEVSFPKANVSAVQWVDVQDVVRVAEEASSKIMQIYMSSAGYGWKRQKLDQQPRARRPPIARQFDRIQRYVQFGLSRPGEERTSRHFRRAYKASHNVIVRRLKKLQPVLPILGPHNGNLLYQERRHWNHFWFVNALGGFEEYIDKSGGFTISIALIEGGQPILGVVCVPAFGICYYAKGSTGSYRIDRNGQSRRLPISDSMATVEEQSYRERQQDQFDGLTEMGFPPSRQHRDLTCETALAICRVAEGSECCFSSSKLTYEWEIAAAAAILKYAGKGIVDRRSGRRLYYNKSRLTNDHFIAK